MDMSFLISHAVLYIREKLKLEQMGDHMVELLFFYFVVVPIGNALFTWIKDYLLAWIKDYLLARIKKHLRAPMWPEPDFLLRCDRNIENLRTQLENLRITKNKVQELVDAAERYGEVILPRVERWQARVINITKDRMLCLNPMVCGQQSRYAMKKTAEVDKLIQKGQSFDRVSTLRSRRSILENIMRELAYGKTNRIGILGESGVGKTFLANEIYEEAKGSDGYGDPFEKVVMATVSFRPDFGRIQCQIAEMLGLRFDELSTAEREQRLSKIFDGKKRILIILDDIHQKVDLEAFGIRFTEGFKGCKVVLVSRSQYVCSHLDTEMDFTIEALDENEGWTLFWRMAGDCACSPNPSAVEAARNCAGLPRNIRTAANAWRMLH